MAVQLRRAVCLAAPPVALLLLLPAVWLVHHIYFDRSRLPDVEPFLRFELPTIGQVHDARGKMLIELAREYRRVVSYDEVPPILRHALLAAEDKHFFSHSGVEYWALPRVVSLRTKMRSTPSGFLTRVSPTRLLDLSPLGILPVTLLAWSSDNGHFGLGLTAAETKDLIEHLQAL